MKDFRIGICFVDSQKSGDRNIIVLLINTEYRLQYNH